jgi:hypothetical protein
MISNLEKYGLERICTYKTTRPKQEKIKSVMWQKEKGKGKKKITPGL